MSDDLDKRIARFNAGGPVRDRSAYSGPRRWSDLLLEGVIARDRRRGEKIEAISRLLCGNDQFPGDLVQYVKNEIDGRRIAEAAAERLAGAFGNLARLCESNRAVICGYAVGHEGYWQSIGYWIGEGRDALAADAAAPDRKHEALRERLEHVLDGESIMDALEHDEYEALVTRLVEAAAGGDTPHEP